MPCPLYCTSASHLASMSGHGGPRLQDYQYLHKSLSNTRPGPSHQDDGARLPTIQPATPNKGAPSQTTTSTHANVTASSGSSTTESLSGLTSHSSRDSLPAAQARRLDTTPPKQARNHRFNKDSKPKTRWSRGRASSDDTGSQTSSPQPTHRQRQPHHHLASRNPAVVQGRLMATTFGSPSGDSRRGVASPRPKGRGMELSFQHHVTSDQAT